MERLQRHFDDRLEKLKEKVLKMGSIVEHSIYQSINALVNRNMEQTEQVLKSEDSVNMLEIDIEDLCLNLLALYQPQARDLRFITSCLKINNDLERIGDLAVNISGSVKRLLKEPLLKPLIDLPEMAKIAQGMLRDSLDAFVNNDAQLAKNVCGRDDDVDNMNSRIFRELLSFMLRDGEVIERAVGLILIGRNLERIADHATNISEDVVYMVNGHTIKHHIEDRDK